MNQKEKSNQIHVLIIDDNHSFIDSIKVTLKDIPLNIRYDAADRYSAARKLMDEQHYDIIMLDNETETSLKGVDFVEGVVKASDEYEKENFIIFSSRYEQQAGIFKQREIRAFNKPFKNSEFQQHFQRVLASLSGKQG